jgi:hypothetical protein
MPRRTNRRERSDERAEKHLQRAIEEGPGETATDMAEEGEERKGGTQMRFISTTIKRKWLDKILSGEKKSELKVCSRFWMRRLTCGEYAPGEMGINFLCGREAVKYNVTMVQLWAIPGKTMNIDGKVYTNWYEIHLGERIA